MAEMSQSCLRHLDWKESLWPSQGKNQTDRWNRLSYEEHLPVGPPAKETCCFLLCVDFCSALYCLTNLSKLMYE